MTVLVQTTKEVFAYRELLLALTYRSIRVRYKQAIMGMLWAFFLPVLAICTGLVFRVAISHFSGNPLALVEVVQVMVKTVPWLLFAGIVTGSAGALVGNTSLITKIYFPRQVVPLSTMLASLFDFAISLVGLVAVLALFWMIGLGEGAPIVFGWQLLWVPVFLGLLVLMAAGLGMILSCANLFLRDVKYIVQVIMQFGIFLSLVYFGFTELGPYGWIALINPVAPLLEGISFAMTRPDMLASFLPCVAYSAAVAVVAFAVSLVVFDRSEGAFAEYA